MAAVLLVFIVSLLICCAIAYVLGLFWFSDARNRRFRSFFVLGIEVFVWTLLNAITMVSSLEYFPVIYTLRMVMVCLVPFGVVRFVLDFAGSSLWKKRWMRVITLVLPLLDALCMVTNPLHHLYFKDYSFPVPARAPLFWVHTGMDFLFIIWTFIVLIMFIVREARRHPVLILTGVAMLVPYSLNLMYSFGLIAFPHDITPVGFFVTLLLFIFAAYRLQLFNIKTALFSSTMDAIGDIIVLFNEKRVVMDANRSALEAFADLPLMVGRTRFDDFIAFLNGRAASAEPEGLLAQVKTNEDAEGECTVALRQGAPRTYTLGWHTVYQRGKRSGHIMMMADVSSYREMISEINAQNLRLVELKEEAEAASRAKGEFLSRMSHEMRTPMNAVIGMTQVALKGDGLEQGTKDALGKIEAASNHLLGVINDVLDMSKIESGKFGLVDSSFALEELLRKVSVLADMHTAQKRQHFAVQLGDDIPPVLVADSQRLMQVITNLLSNAFKFTPEGGNIELDIRVQQAQEGRVLLRFAVQDDGIGILDEQQQRLFRPFEQADGSISRHYGGTGLGLAISKNIVELMGGDIWLESRKGEGARFVFTVWAGVGQALPGARQQAPEAEQPGEFEGCHILLAEDIDINREVILALLDGSGARFDIAENGKQAVEMFKSDPQRYHMLLMDIQMPEMDGFAATAAIRASGLPGAESIPIIAMTANAFKEDIDACLAAGMNDHLAKPIDLARVRELIRKYYHGALQSRPKECR